MPITTATIPEPNSRASSDSGSIATIDSAARPPSTASQIAAKRRAGALRPAGRISSTTVTLRRDRSGNVTVGRTDARVPVRNI